MGRRNEHSRQEIRDLLLSAAAGILDTEGRDALTARRVAGHIGYTVGTVYVVFRNLDELIVHLNHRCLLELKEVLQTAAQKEASARRSLGAIANAYFRFARDNTHRWRLVFTHRAADGTPLPAAYLETVHDLLAIVERALTPALPGVNREHLARAARALWSGLHGICMLSLDSHLDASEAGMDALSETLLDQFLGSPEESPEGR